MGVSEDLELIRRQEAAIYSQRFGLVAVDRETQQRTIKPSATILGNIARRNSW